MTDLSEFRQHWRALLACFVGMGSALSINNNILGIFGTYIPKDLGWTSAQWATTGTVVSLAMLAIPVSGWLADRFGVRKVAAIGIIIYPLSCIAISLMGKDIKQFVAIYILQTLLCCTTTATVYTRVIAERFQRWRGLALGIAGSSPAFFAAIGGPLIAHFVPTYGWRNGYLWVAAFSAICGALALYLLPRGGAPAPAATAQSAAKPKTDWSFLAMPAFWALLLGLILVNAHASIVGGVFKPMILDQGAANDMSAAWLYSLFFAGTIAGRFASGLALDHFPAHRVAAITLGTPALGLLLLSSSLDATPFLALSVLLIGLAFGGEGDVIGYLVARYFGIRVYGAVMGLATAGIAAVSASGHALQGSILKLYQHFTPFIIGSAACVVAGSLIFLWLGRFPAAKETPD